MEKVLNSGKHAELVDVDVLKDRIKLLEKEQKQFNRIIAHLPKLIYISDLKNRFRQVSYILDKWKMKRRHD